MMNRFLGSSHKATAFRGFRTVLSVALFLSLLLPSLGVAGEHVETLDESTVDVFFFDIGQGDGILVQTADGKNLLIDTGPPGAREKLLQRLMFLNVNELDGLVVTHAHADHMGNALALMEKMEIRTIFDSGFAHNTQTYASFLEAVETRKLRYVQPRKGMTFNVGKHLVVEVLGPEDPLLRGTRSDPNTNSIILRLVAGETTVLLTGDAEHETEVRLLNIESKLLQADILKVAHHGSRYASSTSFLKRVNPKDAVISCSRNNSYGHPAPETLSRLADSNISVFVTATMGDIALRTDGKKYTLGPANFQVAQASSLGNPLLSPLQIAQTSQIDINNASEAQLVTLKGIGPSKAKAIIAYRNQNGGFRSIDSLREVKGIGVKTVEKLRPFVRIGAASVIPSSPDTQESPSLKSEFASPDSGENERKIKLNIATREELMSLPGIGPAKADRILSYRATLPSGFLSLDQLTSIKGIGTKTLEKLRPLLTLTP